MSEPGVRILFELGSRLHKTASEIERLSLRELVAWAEFFWPRAPAAANDAAALADADALDPRTASRADLRAAFSHG